MNDKVSGHDREAAEAARKNLEEAKSGDRAAAERLHQSESADAAPTEAAEQVASDGPPGRGQSR